MQIFASTPREPASVERRDDATLALQLPKTRSKRLSAIHNEVALIRVTRRALRVWPVPLVHSIIRGGLRMRSKKRAHISGSSIRLRTSSLREGIRAALGWRYAFSTLSALAAAATLPTLAQAQEQTNSDTTELAEVIVTGRRAALENATERKKASESIIDSVVADEAGMLPDNSITEVLQRVSGVTIVRFASLGDPDHFSAEGSGVQVRGLSGVAGRLNGREVFSANGGRGISWGDVTPELMGAVDVYKTSTADLIEGGTGGQIDLRTKMPLDFDGDFNLNLSANVNYGDLSKESEPGGSALLTNTWDVGGGRFGVLLDVAYDKYSSDADFFRMEPFLRTRVGTGADAVDRFIPAGYTFGNDAYKRKREGVYLGLQWQPTDSFTLSQTTFYSKYDETRSGNGVFSTSQTLAVDPETSKFDDGGFLVQSDNVYQRDTGTFAASGGAINSGGNSGIALSDSTTRDISLDFKWDASERLAIKGAVQWVNSTANRRSYDAFPTVQFPTSFAIDLSGDLPLVTLPPGANGLTDPTLTTWQAVMDNRADNEGDLYAANVDFDFKISDDGFFRSVGVGARYGDRTETDLNSGFNWTALGAGWNGSPVVPFANSRPGDTEVVDWGDFFRGDLNLPGAVLMPSMSMVDRFDAVGDHAFYGGGDNNAFTFLPPDKTDSKTKNTAIYAQLRFDGGERKFLGMGYKGNVGARAVRIENTSTGFFQAGTAPFIRDGAFTAFVVTPYEVSGSTKTTRVLPNINVSFSPRDTIQLRLAYNETMDQPSFDALRANGTLTVNTRTYNPASDGPLPPPATAQTPVFVNYTTDSGNPFLKPVLSHNSDISLEWYPSRAASAHLALFHKTINNWLVYNQVQQPVELTYVLPVAETRTETAQKSSFLNSAEAATVKGVEVGGRLFLDSLPEPWNGFGFEANYTYIDSKNPGDRYADIDGIAHFDAPVQGLSKSNYNLTAMFEKGPLSIRLAWSWRGKYLQSTDSNGTNGSYNYFSAPGVSTFADISLPVYGDAYGQLDFGTTWRPSDKFALSLEFNNLTNEITRTLQGGYPGGSNIRSWYVSDRRANLSVRYNFK
jgi:iron complex outermembrane receptor protein